MNKALWIISCCSNLHLTTNPFDLAFDCSLKQYCSSDLAPLFQLLHCNADFSLGSQDERPLFSRDRPQYFGHLEHSHFLADSSWSNLKVDCFDFLCRVASQTVHNFAYFLRHFWLCEVWLSDWEKSQHIPLTLDFSWRSLWPNFYIWPVHVQESRYTSYRHHFGNDWYPYILIRRHSSCQRGSWLYWVQLDRGHR